VGARRRRVSLAAAARPHDLRLVEDVNAFVHQDTRLLGLVAGRRHMGLGVPLLQVLTVEQLRSVLAHELGHYAGGDTRVSALVYRASATISRTVDNLGHTSVLGRLFRAYARLFQRVSLAVRRRQELLADEGSVRVTGPAVHESALREAQAAAVTWEFYLERYVGPLWQAGSAPTDLYAGFRSLLADPVRQGQVDSVRRSDDRPTDSYDSHPSLTDRVAHVRHVAGRDAAGEARPSRVLLRAADALETAMSSLVNARVLGTATTTTYALAEPLDPTPYVAGAGRAAAALSRATAAVDGGPEPAGLGRTLRLLEDGRDEALVVAMTGDRRDLGEQARTQDLHNVVDGPLALAASAGLAGSGIASWRASWSRPVELVGLDGVVVDLAARLDQALTDSGVARLRPVLTAAGVPLDDGEARPTVRAEDADPGHDVLAVWPELAHRLTRVDAYVTRDLLVLVPVRTSGSGRLRRAFAASYGLGRAGLRAAVRTRVEEVLATPLSEVVRRPGVRTLRWDDQPSVGFKDAVTAGWVLRLPSQEGVLAKLSATDEGVVPPAASVAALLRQLVGNRLETKVD